MTGIDVDREKIKSKLTLIIENLRMLKYLQKQSPAEFAEDFRNVESAKHLLQVSIEAMIDIANHIISRMRLGRPRSYAESFKILHSKGLLTSGQVEIYSIMVKFRNRVVHLYQKVDPEQVYEVVQNNLQDFAAFVEEIRLFLNNNNSSSG